MTDWYGYRLNNGPTLYVGPLPGRKQIAIYVIDGSVLTPLGFFRDEEKARRCLELITTLAESGAWSSGGSS